MTGNIKVTVKNFGTFLQKSNINLPHDSMILLLDTFPNKTNMNSRQY